MNIPSSAPIYWTVRVREASSPRHNSVNLVQKLCSEASRRLSEAATMPE